MKHEVDDEGNDTHIDVDPFIPTGICAICQAIENGEEPPIEGLVETPVEEPKTKSSKK